MKYCLPILFALFALASCTRNNEDMPVCQLSSNPPYYYYQSGYNLHLPTAFTPNGDGRNDRLRAVGNGSQITQFQLTVIDKDGATLFETTDTTQGWDGRSAAGTPMAPGRYQVRMYYRTLYGETITQTYCIALLSYNGTSCIPQSSDGTYYFEDMFDSYNGGFRYNTAESICN